MPERWDSLRRISAAVTVLALAGVVIGLPAPMPVNKHSDEPFPCQHHACGCLDAEMCRTHCGCFKPAVKSCCAARSTAAAKPADGSPALGATLRATTCSGTHHILVALAIPLVNPSVVAWTTRPEAGASSPVIDLICPKALAPAPAAPPPRC